VPTDPIKYSWLKSKIVKVDQNRRAVLTIETFSPVQLAKHEHYADLYKCVSVPMKDLKSTTYTRKVYDINGLDLSHLIADVKDWDKDLKHDYLDEISLDRSQLIILTSLEKSIKLYRFPQQFSRDYYKPSTLN